MSNWLGSDRKVTLHTSFKLRFPERPWFYSKYVYSNLCLNMNLSLKSVSISFFILSFPYVFTVASIE